MTDHLADALAIDVMFATGVGMSHVARADLDAGVRRSLAAGAAAGWTYVSLLHGDPETPADEARLARVRRIADQFAADGTLVATRGGNDWTTWCLRGPRAGLAQLAITGAICLYGATWWRWTLEGTPPASLADGRPVSQDQPKRATGFDDWRPGP